MGKIHYAFLFGEIDEQMGQCITEQLAKISIEAQRDDCVALIIKSKGGIAGQAYEITEAMSNLKLPCITVGHKTVGSAATIVLANGQIRLATADTNIIHHNIRLQCNLREGLYSPQELIDLAISILEEVEKMSIEQEKIWSLVTRDSLLTPKKIKNILKKSQGDDLYFDARSAKKLKLIHDIVPTISAIPAYINKYLKK